MDLLLGQCMFIACQVLLDKETITAGLSVYRGHLALPRE